MLDGAAGLWCTNAGHNREPIVAAIQAQAAEMDFAPPFQYANPKSFELASRIAAMAPDDLDHVFFCNSGSEAVDTAMKIALAYWNARGQGAARSASSAASAAITASASAACRSAASATTARRSAPCWPASTICRTPITASSRPSRRASRNGARIWPTSWSASSRCNGDNTIAAVFVEPMAGSTAVLPAPKGYLQRLRAICDKYKILLVFDEVITGFGRLGHAFAAERYGVVPDMITFAKGVTSGSVPMGGVIVKKEIHEAFMNGPEHVVEFFHGYTYSAHPLAVAAGLATLDVYRDEGLFERAKKIEPLWYDACMSLKGLPNVLDIRCVGITVGIDLASKPDGVGKRGFEAMDRGFHEEGHDAARGRRFARDVAAADRQRKSDRRDFRQDRAGHQGGGIASRFARLGSRGNCSCARVTDAHLSNAPERLASRAGRL